jgi:uncharacterized membrane protein YkvA (DUF1232 family)
MQKRIFGSIIPSQGGVWRDTVLRVKLIFRLLGDKRVSPWLKILPIAGVLYLVSPLQIIPDLLVIPPFGEIDEIAILWLTNHFFIEFCPPDVVREHVRKLVSNNDIIDEELKRAADDDVVDGETTDVTDRK